MLFWWNQMKDIIKYLSDRLAISKLLMTLNLILYLYLSGAMEKDAEIKIIMEIGNEQVEKIASCKLEEGVSNEFVQGNFKCTVELDPSEGKLEPSTISLSPENTEINGISDLDKIGLNPSLTDNAIAEIKKRVENGGKVNDLSTWLLWRKNITNSNFNYGLD